MTPREAFGVVDSAIARATKLPVSYVAINAALNALHMALDRLDHLEVLQKSDAQKDEVESETIEATDL